MSIDIGMGYMGVGLCAGLSVLGASIGIGLVGSHATEAMARQPEMRGPIMVLALVLAALPEALGYTALILIAYLSMGPLNNAVTQMTSGQGAAAPAAQHAAARR